MVQIKRFVYVLKNTGVPPSFYTGLTEDVDARVDAHNAGRCRHTASRRP
jgi:predicted GIY-YIG superfamily endonuclease